jgi:hypothetical protein
MRRLFAAISATAFAITIFAGPTLAVSPNANPNACFGQGRADYALNGSFSVGYWASMRKGDNAAQNAAYRDACQP